MASQQPQQHQGQQQQQQQPQPQTYAASTYSQSTTYSYEKMPETKAKAKRSFKQRVKNAIKDIGTSPFEYEDGKQPLGWTPPVPPKT